MSEKSIRPREFSKMTGHGANLCKKNPFILTLLLENEQEEIPFVMAAKTKKHPRISIASVHVTQFVCVCGGLSRSAVSDSVVYILRNNQHHRRPRLERHVLNGTTVT